MNDKTFFDKSLYIEGLRQSRVLGIINLVITLIIGIIIPVGGYISELSYYEENKSSITNYVPSSVSISETHFYYIIFIFFTLIMMLSLFSFLNKRDESDFYHSIPHTRRCLFISFSAAVYTWIFASVMFVSAISAILYKAFSKFIILESNDITLFIFGINIFIICLLIGAAALFAQSICGNSIAVLLTFVIILFMPRVFLTIYTSVLEGSISYLYNDLDGIFSPSNNLLLAFPIYIFGYGAENVMSLKFPSLYTLLFAILLYVLALFAFSKRKSETAENSMDSPKLQALFRTISTMLICMIPIVALFSMYSEPTKFESLEVIDIFWIVVSYIGAFFVMLLYEFMTTKNIKAALKTLKTIPLIFALNIACFAIFAVSFHYYLNLRIDPDKVDSVSFTQSRSLDELSYTGYVLKHFEFNDKELISLLSDSFNTYADKVKESYENNLTETNDSYEYYYVVDFNGSPNQNLAFCAKDSKTNTAINETIQKTVSSNKKFQEQYLNLPAISQIDFVDPSDIELHFQHIINDYYIYGKEALAVYKCLKDEVKNLDFNTWYNVCTNYTEDISGYIGIPLKAHNEYLFVNFPITKETPKTYQMLLDYETAYYKQHIKSFLNITSDYSTILETDNNTSVYMNVYNYETDSHNSYFSFDSNLTSHKKLIGEAFEFLKENAKDLSDYSEKDDLTLNIYISKERSNFYDDCDITMIVSKTAFAEFSELFQSTQVFYEDEEY